MKKLFILTPIKMNRKNLILVCLPLLLLQANTCKKLDKDCPSGYHQSIIVQNQSTRTIRLGFYWNYPDTTIGEYNPQRNGTDGVSPDEEYERSAGPGTCWESILKDGNKHWIHFFDNDSLEAIPWDTVRATGKGLLERRLIDLEYLRANDFKVIYK